MSLAVFVKTDPILIQLPPFCAKGGQIHFRGCNLGAHEMCSPIVTLVELISEK